MWKEGRISELLDEGKAIQNRMTRKKKSKSASNEQRFIRLMEQGKISAALQCIGSLQCGVHDTTPEVVKTLQDKHPNGNAAEFGSLIQGPLPKKLVEDVIYENLDAAAIIRQQRR